MVSFDILLFGFGILICGAGVIFALRHYTAFLCHRACLSALNLLSYSWEIEEIAMEWILEHKDAHLKAYFESRALNNSWVLERIIPGGEKATFSRPQAFLEQLLLYNLAQSECIEFDVEFKTRDEIRREWSLFAKLTKERRERFELFLDEQNDGEDGAMGNVIRFAEWDRDALTGKMSEQGSTNLANARIILYSGIPLIPVLLLRRSGEAVTTIPVP